MFDIDMSSPSTMSSLLHPASMVDPSTHSPAMMELISLKISKAVIDYVIDSVVETVDYSMGRPSTSARGRTTRNPEAIKFTTFATNVITRAEVSMSTLLGTLVYISRAKPHLHIALEEWAHERVFLGALICASKYLNDSTLKNVHWALCTGVFGKRDVGRIEREFLDVLDFELGVAEHDFLSHHEALIAATNVAPAPRARTFIHHRARPLTAEKQLPVPPLEPSSPDSSSPSSSSPATSSSSSASSSPLRTPEDNTKVVTVPTKKDLLHSFSIPLPAIRPGHTRISSQDYHPRSHMPVRVNVI